MSMGVRLNSQSESRPNSPRWGTVSRVGLDEVVPGVWVIGEIYVNAFLIRSDGGWALVDSGLAARIKTVRRALSEIAGGVSNLEHVLLTHHHYDHTGGLALAA